MSRPLLVTAGATRNPVDAMRHLSANSTGSTGVEVARALAGHTRVHLLGSPEALLRSEGHAVAGREPFGSTRDLMARMEAWVLANPAGVVVHAAAVGDYEADPVQGKIPSGQDELVLRLRPAPKIADRVRAWSDGVLLVTFKAGGPGTSGEELVRVARAQLVRTGSRLVFANVLGDLERTSTLVEAERAEHHPRREAALGALVDRLRAWVA